MIYTFFVVPFYTSEFCFLVMSIYFFYRDKCKIIFSFVERILTFTYTEKKERNLKKWLDCPLNEDLNDFRGKLMLTGKSPDHVVAVKWQCV